LTNPQMQMKIMGY